MSPGRVLVTSFGPFGPYEKNPSQQVMEALCAKMPPSLQSLTTFENLPVSFAKVTARMRKWEGNLPHVLLHLGVAGSEKKLRLETLARNLAEGMDVDNCNPNAKPILDGGADLETSWPLMKLIRFQAEHPDEVRFSTNAGTYLCNYIYYLGLQMCRPHPGHHVLFVHVPDQPSEPEAIVIDDQASLILELLLDVL